MMLMRLAVGAIGAASLVYGIDGVIHEQITSGEGSWAKSPWSMGGDAAVIMGGLFAIFGAYLLYVAIFSIGRD